MRAKPPETRWIGNDGRPGRGATRKNLKCTRRSHVARTSFGVRRIGRSFATYSNIGVRDFDVLLSRGSSSSSAPSMFVPAGGKRVSHSFTLSDGLPDRMSDIVDVAGISLDSYRKNPIVLLQHDGNRPIGRSAVGVSNDGRLKGTVELAVDATADAAHAARLVGAGVLKGASIGFAPREFAYNRTRGGFDFHKSELLEWSLVSIPAAAGALIEQSIDAQRRQRELDVIRLRGTP
jgi:HK97 family phage prohead protease